MRSNINRKLPAAFIVFAALAASLAILLLPCRSAHAETVVIGAYDVHPICFKDEDGRIRGIAVDVLDEIARREGWKLKYDFCEWHVCLQKLSAGEIDILLGIGYSEERDATMDFTSQSMISNWALMCSNPSFEPENFLDLEGCRIAMLRGDLWADKFRELAQKFGVNYEEVLRNSYSDVLLAVEQNEADAGVLDRMTGVSAFQHYDVLRTPIVFSPLDMLFGVPEGDPKDHIAVIDAHMARLKQDSNSVYHSSLSKWLTGSTIPVSLAWLYVAIFAIALAMLLAVSYLLLRMRFTRARSEVKKRTFQVKRSQEALSESKEQYKQLVENSPIPIVVHSEYEILFANKAAAEALHVPSPSNLTGASIWRFLPKTPEAEEQTKLLYSGEKLSRRETILNRSDNRKIFVEIMATSIHKEGKTAAQVVFNDITARKRAERERARLAAAVENAAEAFIVTEPDGTIVYANPAFEKLTGFSIEEIPNMKLEDLYGDSGAEEPFAKIWATVKDGKTWVGRTRSQKADGTTYLEELAISPLKDNGRLMGYVAVKNDITSQDELQRQLARAQKLESIGRLAGGVAHDFNNMLSPIIGYAEMILMYPDDERNAQKAEKILQAAKSAKEITSGLLAVSRTQKLSLEPVDLYETIEECATIIERTTSENIEVQVVTTEDKPYVRADRSRIEQILLNLSINAADAMPGGGTLMIRAHVEHYPPSSRKPVPLMRPGKYVLMEVSDTGIGIAPEDISRIFEPFYTTKERSKGTGLGLAMVYAIVKQHGGYLDVSSQLGKGTTFSAYLPVTEPDEDAQEEETGKKVEHQRRARILVAEDNDMVRDLAVQVLETCGHKVISAPDASSALEIVKNTRPELDMLLSDVVMPDMSGNALYESLLAQYPDLKVLYMSGYADDIVVEHGNFEKGVNYIQKPFSVSSLSDMVDKVLSN
ncbi:MAG: PAS domain S-box protein [Planctomycetota bacterium]|nr:PAS domain S-box protein [Planctomycetota bacterium]